MGKYTGYTRLIPLVAGAAALAMTTQVSMSKQGDEEEEEFEEAQLYFELNDTDGDLGLHGLIDGDEWKKLEISDADEHKLMSILVRGQLRQQGMTELFFESGEPRFDELSAEEFFERFPEGTYEIEGVTLEGDELDGEVEISHVMGAPPGNVMVNDQVSAVNCDAELPVVSEPVTISWDAVTQSHQTVGTPGVAVTVQQYQVVGEIEREGGTPELLELSVILPPNVTEFEFPEGFTGLADGEIKFEIVTKLDNGNQTAVESCFELE